MILLASGVMLLATAVAVVLFRGGRIDPEPPPGPDGFTPPELTPSSMNVRVRYSLDRLRQDLERAIPESYGDLQERYPHPADPGISYAVQARRDHLELEARDDLLHLTAVLGYQGRVWLRTPFGGEIRASCEPGGRADNMPRARIELSTPIALDAGWRLRSDIRVVAVEPTSDEERCRLSVPPFSLDATDLVMELVGARLQARKSVLDSLLASVDVRTSIAERWNELREPLRLADDAWLLLEPLSIQRGTLELGAGGEGAIELGLSLLVRPHVIVGERPSAVGSLSPALEEAPVDEGFTVHVETRIDYAAASRILERGLRGWRFQIGDRTIRITDALVFPASEGRLAIELGVDGAARGRLYLVGRPALDPVQGVVTIPDLRFSAATRNVLLRAAVWLVDAAFAERVRRYARWPFGEAMARARILAAEGLNRSLAPGFSLSGDVTRLSLEGVEAGRHAILVRASLQGVAKMEIGSP